MKAQYERTIQDLEALVRRHAVQIAVQRSSIKRLERDAASLVTARQRINELLQHLGNANDRIRQLRTQLISTDTRREERRIAKVGREQQRRLSSTRNDMEGLYRKLNGRQKFQRDLLNANRRTERAEGRLVKSNRRMERAEMRLRKYEEKYEYVEDVDSDDSMGSSSSSDIEADSDDPEWVDDSETIRPQSPSTAITITAQPTRKGRSGKFPLAMVRLCWKMLNLGVSTYAAGPLFSRFVEYLYSKEHVAVPPSQSAFSRMRQSQKGVSALHGALTLYRCISCTLLHDGTSLNQLKLGALPLGCLMADGIVKTIHSFVTLSGGTSQEGRDQAIQHIRSLAAEIVAFREYAAKRFPEVDVSAFVPEGDVADLEEEMWDKVRAIMSDNANAATATSKLIGDGLKQPVTVVGCLDHVGDLAGKEATKVDDPLLIKAVGKASDPEEFSTTGLINSFLRALFKQFSHGPKSYARGQGVVGFRRWLQKTGRLDQWLGLLRIVGNRFFVNLSNAGTVLVMMPLYTEHLWYSVTAKAGGLNNLERLLLRQCGNPEIKTVLCARARFFFAFLQPLRVALHDEKLNRRLVDLVPTIQALENALDTAAIEGVEQTFSKWLLDDPPLLAKVKRFRAKNPGRGSLRQPATASSRPGLTRSNSRKRWRLLRSKNSASAAPRCAKMARSPSSPRRSGESWTARRERTTRLNLASAL
jgi:hypothetical protein